MASLEQARLARPQARLAFSRFGTVTGVGIARAPDGGYGLKVNLTRPPAAGEAPPDHIDDVPVWFDIVDRIISQSA